MGLYLEGGFSRDNIIVRNPAARNIRQIQVRGWLQDVLRSWMGWVGLHVFAKSTSSLLLYHTMGRVLGRRKFLPMQTLHAINGIVVLVELVVYVFHTSLI